jgi:hypothetical protein
MLCTNRIMLVHILFILSLFFIAVHTISSSSRIVLLAETDPGLPCT